VQRGEDPPGTFREMPAGGVVKPRTGERMVDEAEFLRLVERKSVAESLMS